jgi:tetratricopeptide (TPR) repeat protein
MPAGRYSVVACDAGSVLKSSHHGSRPAFIGRADELTQLSEGLEAARDGSGSLILLSGPPGIGKSRLAAEFMHEAATGGTRVLLGRSWEAGGAPPYWPWVQSLRGYLRSAEPETLMEHLGEHASALATILPELARNRAMPPHLASGDSASDRFQLFDALTSFLANLSKSEALVIVLEDLQAADIPTLLLLEFVTGEISETGVLIIATYRDVEVTPEHALARTLSELQRSPVTTHLTLGGLDAREVAHLIEATSGIAAPAALTAALHRQTSGNPLFLEETVRLLTSDSADGRSVSIGRGAVPAEVRVVIERRLEGLSGDCRELLKTASVLGNDFDVGVVSQVAYLTVEAVLDLLGEAIGAGLVMEGRGGPGTFGFAHDVIRQTLYAGLPPAVRTRSHRLAAEILEAGYGAEDDDHLAEIALHYFEAAVIGDRTKAVEYGRRAGEQAVLRLAYEEAVRLFEMAADIGDATERTDQASFAELLLSLGDARVRAGDLPGAGEAFHRAAVVARRMGDARRMARSAIGYGGRFIWARAGSDHQMIPLLQDALVMLGGQDDHLRVRLLSRLACASRSVGDREHGAALARQGLELARQLGDPATVAYALVGLAGSIWWPENSRERLVIGDELVAVGDTEGVVDGHMTRCAALAELGDFAGARMELEMLGHVGGPLRLLSQRWLEGAMEAVFALSDGNFGAAEPWIDEMLQQGPTTPARDNVSAAYFQRYLLRREQGRVAEVEEDVRRAAVEFPWYKIHQLALADVFARQGRGDDARSIVRELATDGFAILHRDNYWLPSMCLASELVALLGDDETAAILLELLQPFAALNAVAFPEGSFGSVSRYLGLVAGVVGDYDSAIEWLEGAIAYNHKTGALPWTAHAHHDMATTLMARGDPGDEERAQAQLRHAKRICDTVGMVALGERVSAGLATELPSLDSGDPSNRSIFRREGEYFTVAFADTSFRLKDSKGLRYVAMLLTMPGREIHVLDLVAGADGVEPSSRGSAPVAERRPVPESNAPMIDGIARSAYRRRLVDLENEIGEAEAFGDGERASRAKAEQQLIAAELAASMGLGGRERSAVSNAERARVNVTRAIRSSMKRIRSQADALGDHLDATIHTGVFCSYRPDPQGRVEWIS